MRLIANISIDDKAGSIMVKQTIIFDSVVEILQKYNVKNHEELILNAVACLTNLL